MNFALALVITRGSFLRCVVPVLLCSLFSLDQLSAAPLFSARFRSYDVGDPATALAVGDLDADGRPDLVAGTDAGVSILFGADAKTFTAGPRYASGTLVHSVAVSDLDGDGDLDLVGVHNVSGSIARLINRGDRTFSSVEDIETEPFPTEMVVDDFNADAVPDLAVALPRQHKIWILLNRGDASFSAPIEVHMQIALSALESADLNGDAKSDLVLGDSTGVWFMLGTGDGSFEPESNYRTGSWVSAIRIADFDRNGAPDIVTLNLDSRISIFLSLNGGFVPTAEYDLGSQLVDVVAGDLDGDGRLDLFATTVFSPKVHVLRGNGDGTFAMLGNTVVSSVPGRLVVADFDADSRLDVAAASGGVTVLFGNGNGSFGPETQVPTLPGAVAIVQGDFDEDAAVDVVVSTGAADSLSFFRGMGNGRLDSRVDTPVDTRLGRFHPTDLNHDSHLDLVGIAFWDGLGVFLGRGDGTFSEAFVPVAGFQNDLVIGDWNLDRHLDVACVCGGLDRLSILFGRGDGTFPLTLNLTTARRPQCIAAGDLDGDGSSDLVVGNWSAGTISVFRGYAGGAFGPRRDFDTQRLPTALALGDLDGDGDLDLLLTAYNWELWLHRGNGTGTFEPGRRVAARLSPNALALADVDGDRHLDALMANRSNTVVILPGRGDATFLPRLDFGGGEDPSSIAIGDLNGDRKLDIVSADNGSSTVSVFLNQEAQTLPEPLAVLQSTGRGRISWRLSYPIATDILEITLQRAEAVNGPYQPVYTSVPTSEEQFFEDVAVSADRSYWYRLVLLFDNGSVTLVGPVELRFDALHFGTYLLPVRDLGSGLEIHYALAAPNQVELSIFDLRGRLVRQLDRGLRSRGEHVLFWNRRDAVGAIAARGVYFVQLRTQGSRVTRKAVLLHR